MIPTRGAGRREIPTLLLCPIRPDFLKAAVLDFAHGRLNCILSDINVVIAVHRFADRELLAVSKYLPNGNSIVRAR